MKPAKKVTAATVASGGGGDASVAFRAGPAPPPFWHNVCLHRAARAPPAAAAEPAAESLASRSTRSARLMALLSAPAAVDDKVAGGQAVGALELVDGEVAAALADRSRCAACLREAAESLSKLRALRKPVEVSVRSKSW